MMKKKEDVKRKSTKPTNKPAKPTDRQRGVGVVELLFAATTIGTAVLIGAMSSPKLPPTAGD
jgi:hypothetical protein